MNLKSFMRMMMCALALFSFVACSDDDDVMDEPIKGLYTFVGDLIVDQNDGTNYTDKNVKIDLNFNPDFGQVKMVVNQVKFAEAMPVRLDMTVEGISYMQSGIDVTMIANNIIPTAMGGPFPQYKITMFNGSINNGQFNFMMNCGEFPVMFKGTQVAPLN